MSRNRFQSAMIGSVNPRLLKAVTALPNLLAVHSTATGGLDACSEQISGEISRHLSHRLTNGRHHMRPRVPYDADRLAIATTDQRGHC